MILEHVCTQTCDQKQDNSSNASSSSAVGLMKPLQANNSCVQGHVPRIQDPKLLKHLSVAVKYYSSGGFEGETWACYYGLTTDIHRHTGAYLLLI
jgi:hypothetical protein